MVTLCRSYCLSFEIQIHPSFFTYVNALCTLSTITWFQRIPITSIYSLDLSRLMWNLAESLTSRFKWYGELGWERGIGLWWRQKPHFSIILGPLMHPQISISGHSWKIRHGLITLTAPFILEVWNEFEIFPDSAIYSGDLPLDFDTAPVPCLLPSAAI